MKFEYSNMAGEGPVNILFLDHTARLGGGEIALFHLLNHLDKRRYRPAVVLGEEGPLAEKLRESNIDTTVLPLAAHVANTRKDSLGAASLLKLRAIGSSLAYAWRLAQFIESRGVRLVHTNSLKADLIGGIAARLAGVPVVWHVRDRIESDYLPRAAVSMFRWLCYVLPDFVVANSVATLKSLRLPGTTRYSVVHSGYSRVNRSSAVVHEGIQRRAAAVKSDPHTIRVGLVGRIARWKGQHIFIDAAARLRERFPDARFQIVGSAMFGEDAFEREIRDRVKSLGVEENVEFLGFRTDVPDLMDQFDVLVHASVTGEPFGQVITEAMIAAKPVVATRGGGVPEIVEEGVTGFLVPMGDAGAMAEAICKLLDDPQRAAEMGLAGRARALRYFTVEDTARRIEYVFERVLNRNGRTPSAPGLPDAEALAS